MFNSIKERYLNSLEVYSDMHSYLTTLVRFASKVKHITEFGVNTGVSTCAFLSTAPKKMISYDIKKEPEVDELIELAKKENINFEFKLDNDLFIDIEPTELLLIDTIHCYEQIKMELTLHGHKVSKYIMIHDVIQYGQQGHKVGEKGIMPAIKEFLNDHANWKVSDFRDDGCGLMILEKNPNYAPYITKSFENICHQLDYENFKYMIIVSDQLCQNTMIRVRSGDTLVSTFSLNIMKIIAKWVKMSLAIFDLQLIVLHKKKKTVIIDSDQLKEM